MIRAARWAMLASIALLVASPRGVAAQSDAGVSRSADEDLASEIQDQDEHAEAVEGTDDEDEDEEVTEEAAEDANEEEAEDEEAGEAPNEEGRPGMGPAGVTASFLEPPRETGSSDITIPIPPVLFDRHGQVTTTAVFPMLYLREEPGSSELIIPPIYHREAAESADVVFPLVWWWRAQGWHTWVAGPVFHHEDADSHDFGIAPLLFTGRHHDRYYHVLPELLTVGWGSADEDLLFAGGLFYRWRLRQDEHWGVFPFLWVHNSPEEEYTFVPPVFWRWRNPEIDRTLHVVTLFYHQQDPHESFWGFGGLIHHDEGPGFHSTTIPPLLFHWSEEAATAEHAGSFRLSTPFFLYMNERGSETVVSWVYQRYRGATEFDGVMPFYLHTFDPRDHSQTTMATPLVWNWSDPGRNNWAIVPFFLHLDDYGRSRIWLTPVAGQFTNHETHDETTWVLPTIQVSRWHDGDAVNIHPLFYYESVPSHRHAVVLPVWWDFEQFDTTVPAGQPRVTTNRYTVALPFVAHIHEGITDTDLVLTNYYRHREWRNEGRWEWEIHVSGLFDYGETSEHEQWWRILYGLVGFEHRADHDRLWLFWMPIDFGHPVAAAPAPTTAPVTETAQLPISISLQ